MAADLTRALETVAHGLGPGETSLDWSVGTNLHVGADQGPLETALRDAMVAAVAGVPQGARVTVTADRETEECVVRLRADHPLALREATQALEAVARNAGGFVASTPMGFVARIPRA